ncbi:MAG: hypothetical protein ABW065_14420 [Solirubrobacterales bacterium]
MIDLAAHSAHLSDDRIVHAFLDVNDPFVAWQVYRGAVVSSANAHATSLSLWTAEYLRALSEGDTRQRWFETELAIEQLRVRAYPRVVSRLRGFFAFPDRLSAVRAAEAWPGRRFDPAYLAELFVLDGARISRHDSNWISRESAATDGSWIDAYLAGEQGGRHPIWELLVDGRAVVFGTELRERAYETVRQAWPDSLALLEIARLGGELGSDLGLIAPMVLGDPGNGREVAYCVDMRDAKNESFLERLRQHRESGGAMNWEDLDVGADTFTVPDLTNRSFRL